MNAFLFQSSSFSSNYYKVLETFKITTIYTLTVPAILKAPKTLFKNIDIIESIFCCLRTIFKDEFDKLYMIACDLYFIKK